MRRTGAGSGLASPPVWLILATVALTALMLYMAVAETSFRGHYLIDQGEYVALAGLAFVLGASILLYKRERLRCSLPLLLPWFVYPLITQGDQLIDNLTINQMRVVVHVLLAIIFAAPIVVIGLTARYLLAPDRRARESHRWWTAMWPGLRLIERGKIQDGIVHLTLALIVVELGVAHVYLGSLMVLTLSLIGLGLLWFNSLKGRGGHEEMALHALRNERRALGAVIGCVVLSLAGYGYYKYLPTSEQGSVGPGRLIDDGRYVLDETLVAGPNVGSIPDEAVPALDDVITAYSRSLNGLFESYYILDRNYNYWFHNELFLRNTPVMADFRKVALARIAEMRHLVDSTGGRFDQAVTLLGPDSAFAAFLLELRRFVEYHFERAREWETISAEFEKTRAGLQHATHLYEGKNKALGEELMDLLAKYQKALSVPAVSGLVSEFVSTSHHIEGAYRNRIVGF